VGSGARPAVRGQHHLPGHPAADKAQTPLVIVQPTSPQTHIALHPAVVQRVPVSTRHREPIVEADPGQPRLTASTVEASTSQGLAPCSGRPPRTRPSVRGGSQRSLFRTWPRVLDGLVPALSDGGALVALRKTSGHDHAGLAVDDSPSGPLRR
jgi:hypothetical protein